MINLIIRNRTYIGRVFLIHGIDVENCFHLDPRHLFRPRFFLIGSRRRFEKLLHAGNWEPICAKEKESEKEDGGDRVIFDNA